MRNTQFFVELHLYLFERITDDKLWLYKLEFGAYVIVVFFNELSEPVISGEQLSIFVASDKI